jgi:hypothetical protein
VLKPARGRHLPLYFTEYGYFASGKRKIAESKHAAWLKQAFVIAQRTPRVKQMLQYLLVQPPKRFSGAFFDTSILTTTGATLTPFSSLVSWSKGAAAKRQILLPRGPIFLPPAPPGSSPAPRRR